MRLHVNLRVDDLEDSIRFYSGLLGVAPTVRKPEYAKWMLEDPRVNLSIATIGSGVCGLEHLGIQAESPAELSELRERTGKAGLPVVFEGKVTCCYAQSEKSWVRDRHGVLWELFHTEADAETYGEPGGGRTLGGAPTCCAPDCCEEPVEA